MPPAPLPGEMLFWVIEHAGGLDAALSVHAGDAFTRIGFDDGDPVSAAVDPFTSTVEVSGTAVRVIPKDAGGTALGRGLDFGAAILAGDPGMTLSPVRDTGNGTYELRVEGSGPGALTLVLTVEGVELDSLATVELP